MRIATARERAPGERRVALAPEGVARLRRAGHEVAVEGAAGAAAGFPDAAYAEAGALVVRDGAAARAKAEILVQVRPPEDLGGLGEGAAGVALFPPRVAADAVRRLAAHGPTVFALDRMPRTSRAQAMDVLSSMSTVAGYRAAVLAAFHLDRLFPLLMTAAGTIAPARVLVLGAGVAGLQAIATARRLGALVEAFDTRPAAQEEAQSLGARIVRADVGEGGQDAAGYALALSEEAERREREVLAQHVAGADAVITTALVPGRPAPRLVTAEMAMAMRKGSVIIDLAAPTGGNCALTRPGETVEVAGVTVLGPLDLPAEMPGTSSRLFDRNLVAFLEHLAAHGGATPDLDDPILAACCAARRGEVRS
jgi:NAD(P) transhydrogenase subunit alpha